MKRNDLFLSVSALVGAPSLKVVDPGDGWPGFAMVQLPSGVSIPLALHVSTVSPFARRPYEFRFQNPGAKSPVSDRKNSLPLFIAISEARGKTVLVGVDARSRVGRRTRFSILFHKQVLQEAAARGWAVYTSSKGERIYAFLPPLLTAFVEMLNANFDPSVAEETVTEIAQATYASGLLDDNGPDTQNRARRAIEVLIRHYAFGREVVKAYARQCAMCGLNFGLVVGAHIFPAGAPGSPDKIWNGLALCHNHHALFDSHRIWVDPISRQIKIHPSLFAKRKTHPALNSLLANTYRVLVSPDDHRAKPRKAMFNRRYEYYEKQYDWA